MKYPILRSGFITFPTSGLRQPNQPVDAGALAILGKMRWMPDNDNFYHQNIQTLFAQAISISKENGLFDLTFQENCLKAASEAFGTDDLFRWIDLQSTNPELTPVHQAFILETLDYITGIPRKMQVWQWIRLLDANMGKNRNNIRNTDYYQKLAAHRRAGIVPAKLSETFVKWVRQPKGFYDFIQSLEVIFGNRNVLSG